MIAQLILLVIISSVSSQLFHHAMTSEDLSKVFSVKSAAEVPNYDVLPISIMKPRNRRGVKSYLMKKPFEAENLTIWLHPTDGTLVSKNVPICELRSTDFIYEPKMDCRTDWLKNFKVYENTKHAATVFIDTNSRGKHFVKGFIGNKYIHPVPSHLIDHARRHRRSVSESFEHESDDETYHIVYDIPQSHKDMLYSPLRKKRAVKQKLNEPIQIPDIIYPEILVIVDHKWNQLIKYKSREDKLKYLLAFWNGVDLRFRSLERPKVRLNIARIVIAMDDRVLNYIKSYEIFNQYDELSTIYNHDSALRSKGKWLYKIDHIIPIESYDLAVTMLTDGMCKFDVNATEPQCTTTGLSWSYGACHVNHTDKSMLKVAFVQDFGNYYGLQTAAHELGHLFGIEQHDDINDNGCYERDGYIMASSNWKTTNSFEWSECSIIQMDRFFRNEAASSRCLFDKPRHINQSLQRYLPGQLMTISAQCKQFSEAEPVYGKFQTRPNCHRVMCRKKNGKHVLIEPAEGSSCDWGRICLHGQCVSKELIR